MTPETIRRSFGAVTRVFCKDISIDQPFTDFAGRFSNIPGTVVLLSGGELDCARFHILATKPWLWVKSRHDKTILENEHNREEVIGNPLNLLKTLIAAYRTKCEDENLPIASGLLGYLSYDLKDCIEDLPRTSIDRMGLPHLWLVAPSIIVVHDKKTNRMRVCIPERDINGIRTIDSDLAFFENALAAPSVPEPDFKRGGRLNSNFTREDYLAAVNRIRGYIASGDVYQVNLSQQFTTEFSGAPYKLFTYYYQANPAPFFAYLNAGDHHIVSTSMERFVLQAQSRVEARPIKGTRPRGETPEEDQPLRDELFRSPKDDAELSMIVDLLRNDIGKVCVGGSVTVSEHKRVEAYQNVWHLVSIVNGTLDDSSDSIDLIRAIFPGGSITGCPKIRSMEIIDELEPVRRHIYTGSIGYISFHNTMDLSIAIRTATIYGGKIVFSVGGGIVYDSDPEDEFQETLHKGKTLMSAFDTKTDFLDNKQWIWINGAIVPPDRAVVPLTGQGFQYGYGFFETILVVNGTAKNLPAHVRRFNRTWENLFESPVPDITWATVITQVIESNRLENQMAAVKLIAAKGSRDFPPYDDTLAVLARPYVHRLKNKAGISMVTYPNPRQSPLADYKTLNYLYCHQAGKWAAAQGADEALILNPDGSVSETNTANLLLIRNKTAIVPVSPHVLPGTMQEAVCDLLYQWGYVIERYKVYHGDIFLYEDVMIANALIGAIPVLKLDGRSLGRPSDLWEKINQILL
jgi:para-aminobenzoate synthetase component I